MGCSGSKTANAQAQTTNKAAEEKTVEEKVAEEKVVEEKIVEEKPVEEKFSTFTVKLEKLEGQELGMTVTFPEKTCLRVKVVKAAGLVPSWNEQHVEKAEEQIREGDLIVDINGVSGSSEQLMEELKKLGPLVMTVKRIEVAAPTPAPMAEPAPESGPEKPAEESAPVAQQDEQAAPAPQPSEEPAPDVQSGEQAAEKASDEPAGASTEEPVSQSAAQDAIAINDTTESIDVTPDAEELKPGTSTRCACC